MKQSTKYFLTSAIFLVIAICLISYNNLFAAVLNALISVISIIAYNKEINALKAK